MPNSHDDTQSSGHFAASRVNEVDDKLMTVIREKADARLAAIGVTGVTKEAVDEIVCSLIEEHLNALHVEQTTNWTLRLCDDMLMEIFSMLTIQERELLGLTCKRFRNLDIELGKRKFDKIDVRGMRRGITITGVAPESSGNARKKERNEYAFPDEVTPISASEILSFFRKAETELLDIHVSYVKNFSAKFDLLSRVLRTVTFQKLIANFENVEDSRESFLSDLLSSRHLENTKVSLTWINDTVSGSSVASLQQTRKLLQKLPKIENLRIHWVGIKPKKFPSDLDHPMDRLIDDSTLLHIVSNTNYAVLCMSDCTLLGILNAFAEVSQSDNKYAFFIITRATFDKLSAMECGSLHKKYVNNIDLHFIDRERKYVMVALPYKKYAYVSMGRMDEDETIIVKWPELWDQDSQFG